MVNKLLLIPTFIIPGLIILFFPGFMALTYDIHYLSMYLLYLVIGIAL